MIEGAGNVNATPLLVWPATVTITLPLLEVDGATATMLAVPQLVTEASVPLKLTVLVPCVAPKFAPLIVTAVPAGPDAGLNVEMLGAGTVTVKATALLV